MPEPFDLLKTHHLHSLKSVGHHLLSAAREKGEDTAKPLAFIGLVTIAIGAIMLLNATKQRGKGDGWSRREVPAPGKSEIESEVKPK